MQCLGIDFIGVSNCARDRGGPHTILINPFNPDQACAAALLHVRMQ